MDRQIFWINTENARKRAKLSLDVFYLQYIHTQVVPHWKRSVVSQETGLTIALSEDAKDRQAKHDSFIGQDRETLIFKALLYLNVAVHAQVCRLFCVVYMPLFGLVQARPLFQSSILISSVAGISTAFCTSEVAYILVCVRVAVPGCGRHSSRGVYPRDGSKMSGFYWL